MKRRGYMAFLALGLSLPALAWAQWRGETTVHDGVPHVVNPEEPVEEVTWTPKELWRRGGEDDDILFGLVSQLVKDEAGQIYLLDGQLSEIQVFSPSGEHRATLGREGEGPGEFRNASDLYLGPGGLLGVVQVFPGKIVQLTKDGAPADNFPLPEVAGGAFQLVFVARATPDRVVLAGAQTKTEEGKQMQVSYLKAFDAEGKEIAHFHEEATETRFGGMKFEEKTFSNFQRRWALAPDARVASALDFDAYRVTLWNPDGSVQRVIERPGCAPLQRSAAERKRFQKLYDSITRWNPGSTFEVSPTHAAVTQILFREDGTLWVLPARGRYGQPEGTLARYDVYDQEGRFQRRVSLQMPGDAVEDGLFFVGDRLYVVTDLFGAVMANFGGGEGSDEAALDAEPVTLIAYDLGEASMTRK